MRILYCTNQISAHGGIERILCQKINYLIKQKGYEVILATYEQAGNNPVYFLEKETQHIDLAINYVSHLSYFHPRNLLISFRHFFLLKALIKKHQPDIIISISFTPDQYFLPFIFKEIPKIKELHSSGVVITSFFHEKSNLINFFKRKIFNILKKYSSVVVLNKDEMYYYDDFKTVIIPNFVDFDNSIEKHVREKIIISAGRIAPVKQFDHLIRAWSQISSDFPDWEVKIYGDGNQVIVTELQKTIKDLNISNIRLMGPTTCLNQEMENASIYAMTSATECFPMVLLEAQAAGMTIISYDCSNGPRNIITHDVNGFLTPPNNINQFSQKLAEIINNEDKRLVVGEAAKKNILQFSKENIMQKWDELLLKLLTK